MSIRYTERLAEAGIEPSVGSIGSVGNSYDNALAETINGLYNAEVIYRCGPWCNFEVVEYATLEWVDWFNHRCCLSPLVPSRPLKPKSNTMLPQTPSLCLPDSNSAASGKSGAVQFHLWSHAGVWERLFYAMADTPDFEYVLIDSTISKVHADVTGAEAAAIGRSRGGLTTKLHATVDATGSSIRIHPTPGQHVTARRPQAFLTGLKGVGHLIAEAAYDAGLLRAFIADNLGATAQIKTNPSRTSKPLIDWRLYKERH